MIPNTNICVDSLSLNIRNGHYFLTHFHGDHYGGIRKSWSKGTLYCSSTTCRLIRHKFKVAKKYIRVVDFNTPLDVEGNSITFLTANHCPGSVIILFELKDGRNILHTGDFRYSKDVFTCLPHLQPYLTSENKPGPKKTLDSVYLDTTYCNPEYNFPPHEEVFKFVWKIVKKFEKRSKGKYLYLFACYTIGKEKLLLDLARRMKQKIFVSTKKKLDIINCILDEDLGLRENQSKEDYFTRNHDESNIQMGSFQSVFWKNFLELTKAYKDSKYDGIVAFKPSCFPYPFPIKASRVNGNNFIVNVPYSEHTPFGQLKKFVSAFRIKSIIPTVFSSRGDPSQKKAEKANMIRLLREKPKKKRTTHFFFSNKEEGDNEQDEDEDDDEEDEFWNERISREKLVIPKNLTSFLSTKRGASTKTIKNYFSTPRRSLNNDIITPLKSPHPSSFFNFRNTISTPSKKKKKKKKENYSKKGGKEVIDLTGDESFIQPPPLPRVNPKITKRKKKIIKNNNKRKTNNNKKKKRKKKKKVVADPNQKQISQFFVMRKKGEEEDKENNNSSSSDDNNISGKKRKREKAIDFGVNFFQKPRRKNAKIE